MLQLAGPLILQQLLQNIERGGELWLSGTLIAVLFVSDQLRNTLQNIYFHMAFRTGMHIKTGLISAIFAKSLRISAAVRGEMGIGKIVNLQSNDASKIWATAQFLHMLWSGPMQILMTIIALGFVLTPLPAFVGFVATIMFIPINIIVGKKMFRARMLLIRKTDSRVKLTSEVLQGIKAIKFYAWEDPYVARVTAVREEELRQIIRIGFLGLINMVIFLAGPIIVAAAAFVTYVGIGNQLTAGVAFPALALFNLLRFPIMMLPMILNQAINAKVAIGRLQAYFDSPEAEILPTHNPDEDLPNVAIELRDATFQWGSPPPNPDQGAGKVGPPGSARGPPSGPLTPAKDGLSKLERAVESATAALQRSETGRVPLSEKEQKARQKALRIEMKQQQKAEKRERKKEKKRMSRAGSTANGGSPPGGYPGTPGKGAAPALDHDKEKIPGFKIEELSVTVPRGALYVVVGEVGSGKTSLLMAMLKEMEQKQGTLSLSGSLAYTSQDPWIQNATLRANVLMGRPMDDDRYHTTLDACALEADLAQLSAADETEIGEKGVNLSGGQKHRVALARAVYADADIYLLDDPLSAVDAHVGQHLFNECLAGVLKDKTRVLVTHQLQFLSQADMILVMEKGKIAHHGTFEELKAAGVSFTKYEMADKKEDVEEGDEAGVGKGADGPASKSPIRGLVKSGSRTVLLAEKEKKEGSGGNLTGKEHRTTGGVKLAVYGIYFRAWGPFFLLPLLTVLAALIDRASSSAQQFWLAIWSAETERVAAFNKANPSNPITYDQWLYVGVYCALGMGSVVFTAVRTLFTVLGSNNASRNLSKMLLGHVVRLPMGFFDSQPLGRLLNRFTADLDAIDVALSQAVGSTITTLVSVLGALGIMIVASPLTAAPILLMGVVYWRIQRIYVTTSREVKRLDSISLSPIFSLFSETIQGLPTIRAFRKQDELRDRNLALLNTSNRAYWPHMTTNRWLSMRLETLGNFVTTFSSLVVVVIFPTSAGYAGLVISTSMTITGVLNWLVRQVSELEVAMNAVERVHEYHMLPTEAPAILPDHRPDDSWPAQGAIAFQDLQVRYRPGLDLVLKGLTVSIAPCEKIGVCGRTGCGKSTLMLSIYRILEAAGGSIRIDGLDISTIGLYDLRSKLALVPQDPVIFSGTVRSNLDPFDMFEEHQLWSALDQVKLDDPVRKMGGLDATIAESGGNLSVGQRQLLCMARALLRNAKILLLDEATSSVDNVTDSIIQETIRRAFVDCTVLTIAHRLHTIIDADKIMLLEAGELKEFASPAALLQKPDSHFTKLVDSTSKGASAQLRVLALEAEKARKEGKVLLPPPSTPGREENALPDTRRSDDEGED